MGITPAERKLDWYQGKWQKSVDPVFSQCAY
jgi:gamma-glutamylcysteine synthetase